MWSGLTRVFVAGAALLQVPLVLFSEAAGYPCPGLLTSVAEAQRARPEVPACIKFLTSFKLFHSCKCSTGQANHTDEPRIKEQGRSTQLGWEAVQSYMAKGVDTGMGEGSEPVESITNAQSRHCLSDYRSKELHAINIHVVNIY